MVMPLHIFSKVNEASYVRMCWLDIDEVKDDSTTNSVLFIINNEQ